MKLVEKTFADGCKAPRGYLVRPCEIGGMDFHDGGETLCDHCPNREEIEARQERLAAETPWPAGGLDMRP